MSAQRVAVYGLGRVGMPLAAAWLKAGFHVVGYDVNTQLIDRLRSSGFEWIDEPGVASIFSEALGEGRLSFTADGKQASSSSNIHIIAVPTPIDWASKRFVSDPLASSLNTVASGLKNGDVVILESSVPPGTTCGFARRLLEESSKLVADKDFYLGFSPERIFVGRALEDLVKRYPKIVGGVGPKSARVISSLYSKVVEKGVIVVRDSTTAEVVKLFEGVYRDVNIALANELALYSQSVGVDYYEVRDAANSQPYSHLHLPGPGVGGMCIPVYPYFVMEYGAARGFKPKLLHLARQINESMPQVVVNMLMNEAASNNIDAGGLKVTILGAAFRGNVSDTRNSPTHTIVAELKRLGVGNVVVHDPIVISEEHLSALGAELVNDLKLALKGSNGVILVTDHSSYYTLSLKSLLEYSGKIPLLVVDAKGVLKPQQVDGVVYRRLGAGGSSYACE
ncbi:MAG: nucleotide sugar dehydrogenase [Thermoprotei archaeon]